jgi:dienelactone hydrolase
LTAAGYCSILDGMFRRLQGVKLALLGLAILCFQTPSYPSELVEEETFLKAEIGGWSYRLEVLVIRPAAALDQRWPVALITHGSPRTHSDRPKIRARTMKPQARDLAHRGWLAVAVVRRGFGESEGPFAEGYDCQRPNFRRALLTAADDIESIRVAVSQRTDVDMSRVLGIGTSVGGATMLAWAAKRPPGLVGVINVAGGTGSSAPGLNCDESGLISSLATFGSEVRVPSLWLYAGNDSFFGLDLVRRMHNAFTEAGGPADLQVLANLAPDGHELFARFEGRLLWLPELDRFLRARQLPTWNREPFLTLSRQLAPEPQRVLVRFLDAPTEKAMAISRSGQLARWWGGEATLDTARQKSQQACERAAGEPCDVLAENFRPVSLRESIPAVK